MFAVSFVHNALGAERDRRSAWKADVVSGLEAGMHTVPDRVVNLAVTRIGENMATKDHPDNETASAKITKRIEELEDWRGETLARVRQLIHEADPEIREEWKWEKPKSPGTPVWSHDGSSAQGNRTSRS